MKKFWNADKIVSISAMVISLGTLVVISYQTALINNQTEMLRKFKFTYESAYGEAWVLEPPSTIPTRVSETELD